MNTQQIIDEIFSVYIDDSTELSTEQEVALADRVHKKICREAPFEFLKKTASGNLSSTVPYVALPTDFSFFSENNMSTDNSVGIENNASPKVVFVGTEYTPYQIINFSDRRYYRNKNGYAYLDLANDRLVFTIQPTEAKSYEFDYIRVPTTLTADGTPELPEQFHPLIAWGMVTDGFIIQLFEKARSYQLENQAKYNSDMADLKYYNSELLLT